MRRILIGLALSLVALPVAAQTRDQNMAQCQDSDSDTRVAACTALIQSGQETSTVVAAAYNNRGIAFTDEVLYDRAIADFTQAIALKPDADGAYINRGIVYDDRGLHDRAIADYTQAIALKPDDADGYFNRGYDYWLKGLYDQAIADYTQVIALKPDDANGYFKRGVTYESKGLHDQAIADYRAALKLQPDLTMAQDGLKRLGATP